MSDDLTAFRDEMRRRGVYRNGKPVLTAAEQKKPRGRMGGRRESSKTFYGAIVQVAKVRLASLAEMHPSHKVVCPWAQLVPCTDECHCLGTGKVSVGFLVLHYERMASEYEVLA